MGMKNKVSFELIQFQQDKLSLPQYGNKDHVEDFAQRIVSLKQVWAMGGEERKQLDLISTNWSKLRWMDGATLEKLVSKS